MRRYLLAIVPLACLCLHAADRATENLARSVTIHRDTWGVPHVYAKTDAGAVFGLMYAQAEDNFWQLEEDYIHSLGRAAELYGQKSFQGDVLVQAFEVNQRAMDQYAHAGRKLKAMCDAFAAGVNYYIEKNPRTKPRLLPHFEPWFVLIHDHPTHNPMTLGITRAEFQQAIPELGPAIAPPTPTSPDEGSNMWAISPSRTTTGHAMLLINPHVGFFGGGQRYEAHLDSKEGLHVSGFAILGTPYIRSGHNDRLGWSHTNNYARTSDVYMETFDDPANPLSYRYGNEHRAATAWTAGIKVKTDQGIETRTVRLRKTHHGPVLGIRDGHPLAIRVATSVEGGTFEQRWAMAKARTLPEFKAALAHVALTGSNTIYADREGNIYYLHGDAVPKRASEFDWTKPVDGTNPATEWQGYHKIDELPQVTNPPSGFVQNCNSTPFLTTTGEGNPDPAKYPEYMAPEKDTPRAQRSREILSGGTKFSYEDWTRAGLDTGVGIAKARISELSGQFDRLRQTDAARAGQLEPLVSELKNWDRIATITSIPTTLFVRTAALTNDTTPLLSALEKVKTDLEAAFGTWKIEWGEVNRLQRIHTSGTEEQFNDFRPSVPVPGAPTFTGTIFTFGTRATPGQRRQYGTVGDTYVSVVEFGRKPTARSLLVFGEGASPFSTHFFDQAKLYSEQKFKPAWFEPDEVKRHEELMYHPGAAPFEPPVEMTSREDHKRTMDLLHITELRQGANGSDPKAANAANYDESKANPYPGLPDPLVLKNGQRVTTADQWWKQRRPEIVEDFDREIYGRMPKNTPKVNWEVTSTVHEMNGDVPVITKKLVGHVDNKACPLIVVDIQLTLSTPEKATGPVPVMMEFGFNFGRLPLRGIPPSTGPTWQQQMLAKGWGYAVITPVSIQADNGAGLTMGIIGLVNKGQPRKIDDWGALRAWGWGASRALDYFETDKAVDAKKVGVEGHSRYGKAALVAMAYDPRFAIGYISSSGAGGAKIYRRNWGELVENVAAPNEYHWMAGNFLKYAGPQQWTDLPVDSHELVALCAPRPVFIGAGATQGDGWVDAKGMFEAAAGAGPVYRLLRAHDLGTAEFPPIETTLITGDLGFRQHTQGHTPAPNWPAFIEFAGRYFDRREIIR